MPRIDTGIDTPGEAAIAIILFGYVIAAGFNLYIPDTGVDHHVPKKNPVYLIHDFSCCRLLWRDKLGQISLATTTLFWGAGATLQFIVLEWARAALDYPLSKATALRASPRSASPAAPSPPPNSSRSGARWTCCRSASRWGCW